MTEITMPRLSDSMHEGTILTWLKADGEQVQTGDELLEIETDKATMAYESPGTGVLRIVAQAGETLEVGGLIATLADQVTADAGPADGRGQAESAALEGAPAAPEGAPAAPDGAPAAPEPEPELEPPEPEPELTPSDPVPVAAADGNGGDPAAARATPLARRLAHAHGVDLAALRGTGPRGRITRSDVAAHARVPDPVSPRPATATTGATPSTGASAASLPPDGELGQHSEIQQLTRSQQVVARRMSESKATIPHFQVQTEARMDALLALRAELKTLADPQVVPSLNDFIVKACALALRAHPRANGSYRDGQFELHAQINIGIAVAAPGALVVPTIPDADKRPLTQIAADTRRLAQRVRDRTVTPPELSGATFTVSNLGMYGMTQITPVINPPQAAILGVGALRATPTLEAGRLAEHQQLTLTLSCDHRILYGADAAEFLAAIRDALETPLRLLV